MIRITFSPIFACFLKKWYRVTPEFQEKFQFILNLVKRNVQYNNNNNENFIQFLSYIYLQLQISLKKVIYNWLLDI